MKLIAQGAEAKIWDDGKNIIKDRIAKTYRHAQIDSALRGFRTRREAKVLDTLSKTGFESPKVILLDDKNGKLTIEKIDGKKMRDTIHDDPIMYGKKIGSLLARLHNQDVAHGDPTTSNMIVCEGKVYLIDFGLSIFSGKTEDKAVDLHLLDRAVESAHHTIHTIVMGEAMKEYGLVSKDSKEVMARLSAVRKRGRNKMKEGL